MTFTATTYQLARKQFLGVGKEQVSVDRAIILIDRNQSMMFSIGFLTTKRICEQ